MDWTRLIDPEWFAERLLDLLPNLATALLIYAAFWAFVRITRPALRRTLRRAEFEEALVRLLVDNVYRYALLLIALVMAASQLGINVGAMLAGLGVAGIAVGFAAQDSIANTIAGFLIFWDKPFQVGDFITTRNHYGSVTNITMRTTRIRTLDNTYVVIPNRAIIEEVLVNHSMFGETRVRVPVGIAYKESIPRAREVMLAAARTVEGVHPEPEPRVVVTELGSSSVNLAVLVWTDPEQERFVFVRVLEACKLALDEAGIQIPFPHLQLFVDDVQDRVWEKAARLPALARATGSGDR